MANPLGCKLGGPSKDVSQPQTDPRHRQGLLRSLHQFGQLYIDHEGAVRSAFQTLLAKCGQKTSPKLTLVPECRIERARTSVIVDGALVDLYHLPHGYREAKDELAWGF